MLILIIYVLCCRLGVVNSGYFAFELHEKSTWIEVRTMIDLI